MKATALFLIFALLLSTFFGCAPVRETADIAATTLPVYQFASMLVNGTGLTVTRLVTESVSCLHDYSLNVKQVKAIEAADLVILSGAGLEDFMADILAEKTAIDASHGITLLESCHDHDHVHAHSEEEHDHTHDLDSHIWLSPANAMVMAQNICAGLKTNYPQHAATFDANLVTLLEQLQQLWDYGNTQLAALKQQDLLTFHDGFSYFAQCFDLHILAAVEEESGSETSAHQLIELIELVEHHHLSAIFTETNGSNASAKVIAAETGAAIYVLDMAMAGDDYFAAMYHNIDTIKEALT